MLIKKNEPKVTAMYTRKGSEENELVLDAELRNREQLETQLNSHPYLYPTLDDPNFNIKNSTKKRI